MKKDTKCHNRNITYANMRVLINSEVNETQNCESSIYLLLFKIALNLTTVICSRCHGRHKLADDIYDKLISTTIESNICRLYGAPGESKNAIKFQ